MNAVNGSPKGGQGRPEDQATVARRTELQRASLGALPAGASPIQIRHANAGRKQAPISRLRDKAVVCRTAFSVPRIQRKRAAPACPP
jgi:hypothetical protein